jgi:phosphate uptake regulator
VGGRLEVRRVLRLGRSSYTVTLPLRWCKRLNLKPGDSLVLVDEGLLLKIIPFNYVKMTKNIELDFTGLKDRELGFLARFIGPCTYTLGYDQVTLHVRPEHSRYLMDVKRSVVKLLGVDIGNLSTGSFSYKVLINSDLLDPRDYIKRLAWIAVRALDLLARVFQGLSVGVEEFNELRDEFRVVRITAERSLHTWGEIPYNTREAQMSITLISLLSIATSILLDTLEYTMKVTYVRNGRLYTIVRSASRILASLTVAAQEYRRECDIGSVLELERLEETLNGMLDDPSLEREALVVVSRLIDVVKMFKIMAYALTCITLVTAYCSEKMLTENQ